MGETAARDDETPKCNHFSALSIGHYAVAVNEQPDVGPFFHGTKADLRAGDLLRAGFRSNYRPEVVMNHIYFTALRDGAGLAAELAAGGG
ncbi:hypothetical protein PJL15_02783 [Paenarthrobacter nitroguajacolicus]|nr:hypothetical protein [Paenarthrobacter nitroguajacolicus]